MATVHERQQGGVRRWRTVIQHGVTGILALAFAATVLPVRVMWHEPVFPLHMNDHEPYVRTTIEVQVDDGLPIARSVLESYGVFPGTLRETAVQLPHYDPDTWRTVRFKLYLAARDGCRIAYGEETLYLQPGVMLDLTQHVDLFVQLMQ